MREAFWLQGMQSGHKAQLDCIKAFSETDFTEDLKRFDIPTLIVHGDDDQIVHGDDDQIVPFGAAALRSATLVPHTILKVYPKAPHGITDTHKNELCQDLKEFLT